MRSKERRLDREAYKRAGICTACCKNDAVPGKTLCFDCAEIYRKLNLRNWRKLKRDKENWRIYLDLHNEKSRARYKFRKENCLCVCCGNPRNEDDASYCGRCKERKANWQFQNADRLKAARDARRAKWHCNRCHKPMAHVEYKLCDDCRRYAREQYYKHRGKYERTSTRQG